MDRSSELLLLREWNAETGLCGTCHHVRPDHAIGCDLDLELARSGFTTQTNRNAARRCIALSASKAETLPAPPPPNNDAPSDGRDSDPGPEAA
jgi:hypothetical protein